MADGRLPDLSAARLLGGAASVGAAGVVGTALGLVSTVLAARFFSEEVFGAFVLLHVVAAFLAHICSLGLDLAIARFVSNVVSDGDRRELVGTAILFRLSAVLVVSLGAWLIALGGRASPTSDLLMLAPLLLALESSRSLFKSILQGYFMFSRMATADVIASSSNVILLLLFALLGVKSIAGLVLPKAAALLASSGYAFLAMPTRKGFVFRWSLLHRLVRFGFPLQLNDLMSFAYMRVDTLMIGVLLGPAEIAVYEVARRIPDGLYMLYQPLRSVYYPYLSRLVVLGEEERAARMLNTLTRWTAFGAAVASAAALLFGADILRLLFSARYAAGAPALVLLMISLTFALIGDVLGTSLVAAGEPGKPPLINLVHMAASLLGNAVLVPRLKIIGAALAGVAGPVATNPLNVLFLRRRLRTDITAYAKPLAILAAWSALVLGVRPSGLVDRLGMLMLYLICCVALSVVTRRDLALLVASSRSASIRAWRRLSPGGQSR